MRSGVARCDWASNHRVLQAALHDGPLLHGAWSMSKLDPTNAQDLPASPPEAWQPLLRFARLAGRPLELFLRIEAASGILLLVAAATALVWANSPWADAYLHFWHTPVGIH